MNSSQFMDKQIMGLSGSGSGGGGSGGGGVEFFDLMNPQEDRHQNEGRNKEILPSYDFQPRTPASSPLPADAGLRSWSSVDSKIGSPSIRFGSVLEPREVAKVTHEKEKGAYDQPTVAEIDHTVKKHADNLLRALEGVSSRLSQLESRTRHLENSVDELNVSIGNNAGSTDGKLRHLENILREVQTCVQVLRDKQEIAEAQHQLAKLQTSKGDPQQSETSNAGHSNELPPPPSQPQPIQQAVQPPAVAFSQVPPLPALPAPNAPPPPLQRNPNSSNFPQLPQSQPSSMPSLPRDSYLPPPGQLNDTTHQQYQMSTQQPQAPPQPLPTQHYQSSPQLQQYSHLQPQPPQSVNPPPHLQATLPHQPEESAPYMPPPQTYPPSIRQPPPLTHPPTGPPPQQFYGSNPNMYEPPASRPSTAQHSFSGGYAPQVGSNYSDPYPYSGSPSHYSSSKPSPFSSSGSSSGGSSNYPRLPTAQILPHAPPTETSSGGSSGNRVPIDDVVDKVATMGFSREQVRTAVRKLTESGQAVDLNAVLDKLMNEGELQPPKGWFGR